MSLIEWINKLSPFTENSQKWTQKHQKLSSSMSFRVKIKKSHELLCELWKFTLNLWILNNSIWMEKFSYSIFLLMLSSFLRKAEERDELENFAAKFHLKTEKFIRVNFSERVEHFLSGEENWRRSLLSALCAFSIFLSSERIFWRRRNVRETFHRKTGENAAELIW